MMLWSATRGAIAFLTRIPVGHSPIETTAMTWSPALFPIVGVGLGLLNYGIFRLAQPLGNEVAATLTVAVSVVVTGAFHEDGIADTADALWGQHTRVRTIEIMKDSRIGTYGASALFLVLLLRVTLMAQLRHASLVPLLLSAGLARLGPLWLLTHVDHAAKAEAKHKDLVGIGRSRAWIGSVTMLLTSGLLGLVSDSWGRLGLSWVAMTFVAIYVWRIGLRRLGGITGDLLGACEQLGEVVILGVYTAEV